MKMASMCLCAMLFMAAVLMLLYKGSTSPYECRYLLTVSAAFVSGSPSVFLGFFHFAFVAAVLLWLSAVRRHRRKTWGVWPEPETWLPIVTTRACFSPPPAIPAAGPRHLFVATAHRCVSVRVCACLCVPVLVSMSVPALVWEQGVVMMMKRCNSGGGARASGCAPRSSSPSCRSSSSSPSRYCPTSCTASCELRCAGLRACVVLGRFARGRHVGVTLVAWWSADPRLPVVPVCRGALRQSGVSLSIKRSSSVAIALYTAVVNVNLSAKFAALMMQLYFVPRSKKHKFEVRWRWRAAGGAGGSGPRVCGGAAMRR